MSMLIFVVWYIIVIIYGEQGLLICDTMVHVLLYIKLLHVQS